MTAPPTGLLPLLAIAAVSLSPISSVAQTIDTDGKASKEVAPESAARERKGKVKPAATVYAFFATWCVPCRVELPHLERFHQTYKDQGLHVVLVSEDAPSTAQSVPAFLARFNITAEWLVDSDSEILARYNSSGSIPFTVLLHPDGSVAWAHAGYEPGDEALLESQIQKILSSPSSHTEAPPKVAWSVSSLSLGIWRESRFQLGDVRTRAAAERLEISARTSTLAASVRLDGDLVDSNRELETNLRPERALLRYKKGFADLKLGDDYVQFGHGMTLSLRKIDALGLDTTLRGGQAEASLGRARVKILAGITNRQNLDTIDLQVVDDETDLLAGAEVEVEITKRTSLSPYVLFADAEGAASDGADVKWMVAGLSATAAFKNIVLAAEGAGGSREGFTAAEGKESIWAGYASAQGRSGNFSLLIDAKAYRDWAIGRTRTERPILYHEAPTLERDDQAVPANDNAIGTRAQLEWRVPSQKATLFGNLLGYRYSQDGTSAVNGDIAIHGYLGTEFRFGESASAGLQAGYRDENKADGSDKLSLYHLDVDFATPLRSKLAATFKWNHVEEKKVLFNTLDFRRGLVVGGIAWSGLVAASLLYGYSTEQATTPTHYPGGELSLHLAKGGILRLFGGRLAGGRVCVSGSCRDVPPFEGVRLDLVVNL